MSILYLIPTHYTLYKPNPTFKMKYTFTLAALAVLSAAQSITDLPTCSLQCVATGVSGLGCTLTDFKCACTQADKLTPEVTPCVQSACPSPADQAKVITTLEGICANAGFPINIPEPGASSSASPAPTSAAPKPSTTEAAPESSSVAPTIQTSGKIYLPHIIQQKLTCSQYPLLPSPTLSSSLRLATPCLRLPLRTLASSSPSPSPRLLALSSHHTPLAPSFPLSPPALDLTLLLPLSTPALPPL